MGMDQQQPAVSGVSLKITFPSLFRSRKCLSALYPGEALGGCKMTLADDVWPRMFVCECWCWCVSASSETEKVVERIRKET